MSQIFEEDPKIKVLEKLAESLPTDQARIIYSALGTLMDLTQKRE